MDVFTPAEEAQEAHRNKKMLIRIGVKVFFMV